MKKELSIYHLVVVTMFIGILLTCALFYGINSAIGRESTVADACYDGSVIEGEGFFADFDRSVYQNASVLGDVLESQYRLFGIVGSREVIAGKDDFLFEIEGEDIIYLCRTALNVNRNVGWLNPEIPYVLFLVFKYKLSVIFKN